MMKILRYVVVQIGPSFSCFRASFHKCDNTPSTLVVVTLLVDLILDVSLLQFFLELRLKKYILLHIHFGK